ncbi:MAG: hypothetical protein JWO48_218 [Bryobacterales bacterium]|nr:hypothetical protein [Bryobacterales bacterium]
MRNAALASMRRISLLLLCLAPWVAPLPGATLERLSLDELAQKSTLIARAKVLGSYTDFRGSVIYTHWKLQVVESFKGADQAAVEVLVPGGSAGHFHQDVPGSPRLVAGNEYLLFLWTAKSGSTYVTGLSQGVFELSKNGGTDLIAARGASSETMLDRRTWLPVSDEGIQMRYSDITARISAALSAAPVQGGSR